MVSTSFLLLLLLMSVSTITAERIIELDLNLAYLLMTQEERTSSLTSHF